MQGHHVIEFDHTLGYDITRPKLALPDGIDVIIHLAALLQTESDRLVNYMFSVNMIGTMRLLEAAIDNHIPHMIFASSAAVYDCLNTYGASKLAAEAYCKAVSDKVNVKILRFFNVYGPGQFAKGGALIPKTVDAVFTNQRIIINGDGSHTRDYIYVDDIISVVDAAVNSLSDFPNSVPLDIGTGIETSTNEIVSMIISGYKEMTGMEPRSGIEKVGLDSRRETVYSRAKIEEPIASILKHPLSIQEGLLKTIRYWKEQVLIGRD